MTVAIGPVTLADTEQVAAIERAAFADPWSANAFRALPGDPRVYFACARDTGAGDSVAGPDAPKRVLGYVVAIFAADEGEIANLAVAPDAQRRGIGARLLDSALSEAERRGAAVLYLEVRESNEAARGLYRSRGFHEVGRRRSYYQRPVEDALLLRRSVGPGLK
jgi:[ribosomal protein S18]-alanine N-acetyltransferase